MSKKIDKTNEVTAPWFFKTVRMFLFPVIVAVGILLFRNYCLDYLSVSGSSMYPTLKDNQKILVNKWDVKSTSNLKRGDVIVFKADPNNPNREAGRDIYVKRVIGLPGDTVEAKNGTLYVNNKEVNQDFLKLDSNNYKFEQSDGTVLPSEDGGWTLKSLSQNKDGYNSWSLNKTTVPKGTVFVLGDHRSVSLDSRYFGFVKESTVVGVVKHFPFSKDKDANYYIDGEYTEHFFKK